MSGHEGPKLSVTGTGASAAHVEHFLFDLNGLRNDGASNLIISTEGATSNCAICDLGEPMFGTVRAIKVHCIEAPSGTNSTIGFWTSDDAGGGEGSSVPGTTNAIVSRQWSLNNEEWSNDASLAVGTSRYLYAVNAGVDAVSYTAGKFLISVYCEL